VGKPNKKLEAWMSTLPQEDLPQVRLWKLATDPTLPKTLQIQAWEILCRYFGPILSSSVNKTEGEVLHRPTAVGRFAVLQALASLPEAERAEVLTGKKMLQLEGGPDAAD